MLRNEFHNVIQAVATSFDYELEENRELIYWAMFKEWEEMAFGLACRSCIADLNRFPTAKEIIERRPAERRTIDDIETTNRTGGEGFERIEQASDTEKDELETMINGITNPQLRETCRKLVSYYPQDEQMYEKRLRCLTCKDSGTVEVYDPRGYANARDNKLTQAKIRTLMVACTCDAGEQKPPDPKKKNQCKPLIEFDDKQMKQCTAVLPSEQVAELAGYMKTWTPRNHNSEFDDWA